MILQYEYVCVLRDEIVLCAFVKKLEDRFIQSCVGKIKRTKVHQIWLSSLNLSYLVQSEPRPIK